MVLLFVGLLLAGISLIGWGASSENIIISSLGGALFGASLSALVASLNSGSFYNKILEILKNSLNESIRSQENKICHFRKKWYFYHASEVDGKRKWKFELLDFSKSASVGTLATYTETEDGDGDIHRYRIEMMVRDSRVIMLEKAEKGDEPTCVHIFPHMGEAFHKFHCGMSIKKSWDATNVISPCIISNKDIINFVGSGENVPENKAVLLDEKWSNFHQKNKVIFKELK